MIMCIIELVVGILLLINPIRFTASIIIAVGIACMAVGLLNVIRYFRSSREEAAASQLLVRGLLALLVGAFCAFKPRWFIATLPMIAIFYGVAVLISGLSKVQIAVDMFRAKNSKWWWSAISAVIFIICAVIIIANPFSSTVALWLFTGIFLIIGAVFDAITLIVSHKNKESTEE